MQKKSKYCFQILVLIINLIMILNIIIFSFQNSVVNFYSSQKSGSIYVPWRKEIDFSDIYVKNNIEWEIKSEFPITLEIIDDFDYSRMKLLGEENLQYYGIEIEWITLCNYQTEDSGIYNLKASNRFHFIFSTNGYAKVEYSIKFDSTYFDFIWIFYGFLIFFGIIGVISLNIKTPKKSMIEYELKSDSDLQYISYCSYCGNESENNSKNNTDNKFCLYCGTSKYKNIKHPSTIKVKFCERCGNKIKEDLTICQKCEYMMNIDLLFNKIK